MPTNYTGTPLESDWEKLQRRRELNNAIVRQSMAPYRGTESAVGGRSVDNRLGSGISKIGQALVGAWGNKKLNEEGKALGEQYDVNRKEAMDKVMSALSGQDNVVGPDGPRQPKPDPMKAAMGLLDPSLKHNDISRALINSQAYGQAGRFRPRHSMTPGKEGYNSFNQQTGESTWNPWPGPGFIPINRDPSVEWNMKNAGASGTNTAGMDTNTGKGPLAAYAEAGRQGQLPAQPGIAQPLTPGQEAADKISGRIAGEAKATAKVDAPQTFSAYNKSIKLIDELTAHPGFEDAVGFPDNPFTLGGRIPWTDAAGFRERLDQLAGRGFMEIFPTLKGGGSITEPEGEKGQRSINRMSTATTEVEFLKAANDFKRELFRMKQIVAGRAGIPAGNPPVIDDGLNNRPPLSADKEARFRERLKREQAQ